MKRLLTILALFAATVYCRLDDEVRQLESLPCTDGKAVLEETPDVSYFRIVADSGETLLDINSKDTKFLQLELLLTVEFIHPEYGHWAFAKNSRYYITNNQTTAGEAKRFDGRVGLSIFKEKIPYTAIDNATVIKSDFRCVRIHDFSLVIDPAFDIKTYDGYNMTALLWSSLFGMGDVARSLLERGADVNQGGGEYTAPLIAAILGNQRELVELMIQRGADINKRGKNFLTPLHFAAYVGSNDIVRILLDHGLNPNEGGNEDRLSPVHMAALSGHCDTVELLLSRARNIRANESAFHVAIFAGHWECAHKVFSAGVDVNARNKEGDTLLVLVLLHEKDQVKLEETVERFLREYNPDVNIPNNKGQTPLSIATEKNLTKVVELLKSKGAH